MSFLYVQGDCEIDFEQSHLLQVQDPSFVEYFSGNRLLPGSETAAHCYCGHQFGHFSGQLGDGAAIYLGEVTAPHILPRCQTHYLLAELQCSICNSALLLDRS